MIYRAREIADWFINRGIEHGDPLSKAEIQRLVYFGNAWYMAFQGEALVEEAFEAWPYGPIIPELYRALRRYGARAISEPMGTADLDSRAEAILEEVWSKYGRLGTSLLIRHSIGGPWQWVYRDDAMGNEIPDSLIRDYYRQQLDDS